MYVQKVKLDTTWSTTQNFVMRTLELGKSLENNPLWYYEFPSRLIGHVFHFVIV